MYIQGFVIPVPTNGQDAYFAMAAKAAPVFTEQGARQVVECWGDDVPDGKVTDFRRAVRAGDNENVAFSWIVWPDRETCDTASAAMMNDERMRPDGEMPFDGKRMIYAGFSPALDTGGGGEPGYVDGFIAAVPTTNKAAYVEHATAAAEIFAELGALRLVEGWGEDVPEGKVTDFRRAVQAGEDETVVFSWIEWPDKPTRDKGMAAMMEDPRIAAMEMPFDGKRMVYGGFCPILDV